MRKEHYLGSGHLFKNFNNRNLMLTLNYTLLNFFPDFQEHNTTEEIEPMCSMYKLTQNNYKNGFSQILLSTKTIWYHRKSNQYLPERVSSFRSMLSAT